MKKQISFLSRIGLVIASLLFLSSWSPSPKPGRAIYQLSVYHFSTADQEKVLDNYLQNALLPALHRMSINNVGVFKAVANDTAASKLLYVFISLKSLEQTIQVPEKLKTDKVYQEAGTEYINAVHTTPPYSRMETILLQAFPLVPQVRVPQLKAEKKDRIYELRSYESATEKLHENKVQMFNAGGEIGVFKKLNFNPIFYGSVISGSKMPNLMYMTSFENMDDRNAHWKNFSSDPYWKKLSAMPEYQNNVSHIDDIFLHPTDYSDL